MANDLQTAVRMPRDLYTRLKQSADEQMRSLGDEIRRRLEASFDTPDRQRIRAEIERLQEELRNA